MDYYRVVLAIVGLSFSYFLCVPNLKKRHKQQIIIEKLRMISEALEHAEERVLRLQERHDRILSQMCSYYFIHNELEVSLADARAVLDEAMESAGNLRRMQRKIIGYFPDEVDVKDMSSRPQRPRV
ncbi:hypothetical protein CMV_000256 [Castanea mollissima]|uniref:Uncharacterized protein n=1 Tax=Castanea mollissima TaxID=60419 RepID=A0A8J4RZG3_9ROSI|nr:hypothetical protein CMV_000256 [Castanea mollissima]